MTRVLAIDQGTSATKALLIDGDIVRRAEAAVNGATYDDVRVEQDPELLFASILRAGQRALLGDDNANDAIDIDDSGIDAIGIGNQGETVLAWDLRTGEALGPALSWQDRRAISVTDALDPATADRLTALTGLPLDPYFAGPKMAWLRQTYADLPPGAVITTIDSWVLHRLTGEFVTDAATASRTMLMDPSTLDWSGEALEAFGLAGLPQPRIIACDDVVGTTTAWGRRVPVAGVIVDQQASLLAEGCRSLGDAKCTYGTGAFLLANVGPGHPPSAHGLATSLAWAMRDGSRASCMDGQVYAVGAAVAWLQRIGLIDEPSDLDRLGSAVAASAGATFRPNLAGAGAPVWDPQARGSWSGLSLTTTREHLIRSFCEGIAAQVALLCRAVSDDLGAPLSRLRVDGGLTRSHLLMQSQADIAGIPVEIYPYADATALGVAALALRAIDGPGAEEAIVSGWCPARVYEPRRSPDWADDILAAATPTEQAPSTRGNA